MLLSSATGLYYGSSSISKVYLGSTQVWPSGIGSTTSTHTPTLTSGVTVGTTNGSPFSSSVNSYQIANGSSPYNYVSVPGSSAFAFGTGNYTIEWFQYETDSNTFPRIYWYGTTPSLGISFESTTPYSWPGASSLGTSILGTYKNAWRHFAVVRISSKLYIYKDGVLLSSALGVSNATNITDTTSTWYIGSKAGSGVASEQFAGSITSFRVCKGIGVYTGAFTKPTSKLGQTQSANPYGGSNTSAISAGQCSLLLNP